MEDNPYSMLLNIIRGDAADRQAPSFFIGTVIKRDPLQIDVAGLTQDKTTLRINYSIRNSLGKGDEVLLLPYEDQQRFIAICKVVSL